MDGFTQKNVMDDSLRTGVKNLPGYTGRAVPGVNTFDPVSSQYIDVTSEVSLPSDVGYGQYVQDRRYFVNLNYVVQAQAQKIQYVFTGGISFNYTSFGKPAD